MLMLLWTWLTDNYANKKERGTYPWQLTIMFCDIVGSTTLSEQLDPCIYAQVLQAYQETCAEVIMCWQGYMAQPLGDGILVYFGYPLSQEDDACRALKSGLGIVSAIEQLNLSLKPCLGVELAVRVGVATGKVVMAKVGTANKYERLAVGIIPNLAARLQTLATPNSVVFCRATQKLVEDNFYCRDLGYHKLKGFSEPMQVYQV